MQDLKSKLNFNKGSVEVELTRVEAKKLTTEERNNLPDSEFAYIKPGGKKVDGKTEPRSLRMFPINDADHVRSALSYLDRADISEEAKKIALKNIKKAAKKFGVTVSDSDAMSKKEEKIDKKELKRDTKKEKEEHEDDAIKNDEREIKDLKKDVKFDKESKKKFAKAETDKERQERLERREDKQDKDELDSETLKERLKHHEDAVKNLTKEIKQLEKDKKEDKKDVKEEAKGHYNDKGQYVPYQGPEPKEQVQYMPEGDKPVKLDEAKDEDGKYIPYEGPEPKEQVQYIEVPGEEKLQHQAFMSECMLNDDSHVNTKGLDENRSRMACAIAYDRKYKTSYAPCGPFGCKY